ncbi:MAG: bile acid:sodium symporter [Oceanospirillaceae bacterium]|nr:bile acid:sodium symporter [Oceanospirillaceae bacterium]
MLSIQRFFPILAIGISWLAWSDPQPLLAWKSAVIPLLILIMFCMGLTLRWQDFQRVWKQPDAIALGVVLQFLIMPLLAWLIAIALQLPDELAVGLILVGACAGGTASNVMTFLAGGDVALSVSMTLLSTLWGVVLTPWLLAFYARELVELDKVLMLITIGKLVIIPVAAGVLCNRYMPELGRALHSYLPSIASAAILAILGIVVALNADEIATMGAVAAAAVILHNLGGLTLGYWLSRWRGLTIAQSRTIAIEVGMQNSGLGAALALKFFGPAAALPAALFSVWHNLSGSLLAAWWHWQTQRKIQAIQKQRHSCGK